MLTFEQRVRNALSELLPAMEADGGGVELVACEGESISISLVGSCVFCPSRSLSAAALERGLRSRVPALEKVVVAAARK